MKTWAIASIAGEINRQGPHQVATNSTRTGPSAFKTTSENWLSLISVTPPHVTAALRTGEHRNPIFLWLRDPNNVVLGVNELNSSFLGEATTRTGGRDETEIGIEFETIVSINDVVLVRGVCRGSKLNCVAKWKKMDGWVRRRPRLWLGISSEFHVTSLVQSRDNFTWQCVIGQL